MTDVVFRDDVPVEELVVAASDLDVIQAMWVSTGKMMDEKARDELSEKAIFGRINALMKNRHGTPFEHTFFKCYSEAPIFVYREWHRHRIGVSINEQSGRYDELPPMFYIPPRHRPFVQVEGTKQMDYVMENGSDDLYNNLVDVLKHTSITGYEGYQELLEAGVVKEVARMTLPVNIYSKMVWSCNARSMMAFLSLRTKRGPLEASYPSNPQWEINVAADILEQVFQKHMPLTHRAFCENGRVGP